METIEVLLIIFIIIVVIFLIVFILFTNTDAAVGTVIFEVLVGSVAGALSGGNKKKIKRNYKKR